MSEHETLDEKDDDGEYPASRMDEDDNGATSPAKLAGDTYLRILANGTDPFNTEEILC